MAKLTVSTTTHERDRDFWEGKDLAALLPRLGEVNEEVARLYEAIESRDLDILQATITIRDGQGSLGGGDYLAQDVDLVLDAPRQLLEQLIACPEFREDFLGGITLAEALAEIKE